MGPAIEIDGLAIGYRSRRRVSCVAAGLRAQARPGELTVLLGPNGCGKSTLIRTLCGLQRPLGGRVLLNGVDLAGLPAAELARRIAVVLTDRVDPGLLSARELVGIGRTPHVGRGGRLRPHDGGVIEWALHAVGVEHLAARPAAQLSDGELQRVMTARALAQQPEVLILDEPTAFLDVASRSALFGLLRDSARQQRLAVLVSSHDLELALRVADRVWLLDSSGTLTDAIGEELMLTGQIGELFDSDTIRFDVTHGAFVFNGDEHGRRNARIDAPEPLRGALARVLAREGWRTHQIADVIIAADAIDHIDVHCSAEERVSTTLGELPGLLRRLPDRLRPVTTTPADSITRFPAASRGER